MVGAIGEEGQAWLVLSAPGKQTDCLSDACVCVYHCFIPFRCVFPAPRNSPWVVSPIMVPA